MHDLDTKLLRATRLVDADWSEERARVVGRRVTHALRRRAVGRRALVVVAMLASIACAIVIGWRARAPATASELLRTRDGSTAELFDALSAVRIVADAPE